MVLTVSLLDNNHLLLPRMSRTLSTVVGGSPESGRTTRGPTPKGERGSFSYNRFYHKTSLENKFYKRYCNVHGFNIYFFD